MIFQDFVLLFVLITRIQGWTVNEKQFNWEWALWGFSRVDAQTSSSRPKGLHFVFVDSTQSA